MAACVPGLTSLRVAGCYPGCSDHLGIDGALFLPLRPARLLNWLLAFATRNTIKRLGWVWELRVYRHATRGPHANLPAAPAFGRRGSFSSWQATSGRYAEPVAIHRSPDGFLETSSFPSVRRDGFSIQW